MSDIRKILDENKKKVCSDFQDYAELLRESDDDNFKLN